MNNILELENNVIRLGFFITIFLVVLILEWITPRRKLRFSRGYRWSNNVGLLIIGIVLTRAVTPISLLLFANIVESHGWGILGLIELPLWVAFTVSIIMLDFGVYIQHRIFHIIPILWRLHRVHHTDLDFDVTTGLRFHPLELLVSTMFKLFLIVLIGAPVVAVLAFEIALNGMSMFSLGNFKLSDSLDRNLRRLIVTPDMHRIHHSLIPKEFNCNFGFCLSCWDKFFNSYLSQPDAGHLSMKIGQPTFRSSSDTRIDRLLLQPFRARRN